MEVEITDVGIDEEAIAAGYNQPLLIPSQRDIADVEGRGKSKEPKLIPVELENERLVHLLGT